MILAVCGYAGSSLEVEIETDSCDTVEIKTEADSNDITECLHGDTPSIGMCGFDGAIYISWVYLHMSVCLYESVIHVCIMTGRILMQLVAINQ